MGFEFDIAPQKTHAEVTLHNLQGLVSELEAALAFSCYLKDEAALELQQTRRLIARSKSLLETSKQLLQQRCPSVDM